MQEHVQRLRDYLNRRLTPEEVRDGLISAYLVISRLNQLQGNPEVGLKQDVKGLQAHISGFMGAVFWERGFSFEQPTVEQLSETKMMLDGMVQVYAMPDDLQTALNEMCETLLARGRGEPAAVSASLLDLLQVPDGETSAAPAEAVDEDRMPDENPAASLRANERLDVWSTMPEPASARIEPEPEPAPAPAPEPGPFGQASWEVATDRPDEPRPDLMPSFEAPLDGSAAAEKPVKKRAPRKKAPPAEGGAVPKAPRKRSRSVKTAVPDVSTFEVPEDYLRAEGPADASAPVYAAPTGASEPEPAPAPAEEFAYAPEPAPEPAPVQPGESAYAPEPASEPLPEPEPEPTSIPVNLDLGPARPPLPEPRRGRGGAFFGGLLLGLVLAGGGLYAAYWFYLGPKLNLQNNELKQQVEGAKVELANAKAELAKLRPIVEGLETAWKNPPARVEAVLTGSGVLLFWADGGLPRKYFVYRGRGAKGELKKIKPEAQESHYYLWRPPERGTWSIAVTALDRDGKETAQSEVQQVNWKGR